VGRLRDFIRLNYITGSEVARQMGVRDTTLYSSLSGESRPASIEPITAFLASIAVEPFHSRFSVIIRELTQSVP
jgi:hypothetical protein